MGKVFKEGSAGLEKETQEVRGKDRGREGRRETGLAQRTPIILKLFQPSNSNVSYI